MIPCPDCGRHVRASEADCPFCKAKASFYAPGRRVVTFGALLSPLVFVACAQAMYGVALYGIPEGDDLDGDGWEEYDDCDDTNPDIHPGAAEDCDDDVDNDCDQLIDADDDDCDDTDTDV